MDQVRKLLTKVYRGVGTTRAKRLENLVARGEWALLQQERISDPRVYISSDAYLRDALVVEITRKLCLPGDTHKRKEAAARKFWDSESQCLRTNARLNRFINNGPFRGPADVAVSDFISRWRKEVERVLGPLPHRLEPTFSGGATLSDAGKLVTIPDKMSTLRTVYEDSYDIYLQSVAGTVLDQPVRPDFRRSNHFFTVPKDSETDRGCCKEASGNILLQLAVGRHLKSRYYHSYKVNLVTAQPLHQQLAQKASIDGSYATIDLSNASDTVSRRLVELILPGPWFALLNSLRAKFTQIDGKTVYLEKFSSMGNGFTFELETIVFRSLVEVLGAQDSYVFGDDIIVPTEHASATVKALEFFGFKTNPRKTFCEGPFRESCGGDFFNGIAVRPYYMKELPDEPQHWIAIANGLLRADPEQRYTKAARRFCVDQVPVDWRNTGPTWLGDTVFHDDSAVPVDHVFKSREYGGYVARHKLPAWRIKRPVSQRFSLVQHWRPEVALACAVLGTGPWITPRDSILGYKTDYVPIWGLP